MKTPKARAFDLNATQVLVNGLNGATETRVTVLHKVINGTRAISEGQVEIIAAYGKAYFGSQFNRRLCKWNTSATYEIQPASITGWVS